MLIHRAAVLALLLACGPTVEDGDAGSGSGSGGPGSASSGPGSASTGSASGLESSSGDGLSCEHETTAAIEFLDANTACDAAADCQLVGKGCYEGPGVACVGVGLSADADPQKWAAILDRLEPACPSACGGNECGARADCVEGRCVAVFP